MTEHLPIKQYGARGPLSDPPILGEYIMVTYDDHLAALAAARKWQIVSNALFFKLGRAAGHKDALDDARDAVAALDAYYAIEECQGNPLEKGDPEDPDPWQQGHLIERDDALAAIDALREVKK